MSLAEIRADLASALATEFGVVSTCNVDELDTVRVNPPCVIVTPGDPYLEPDSTGAETVRLFAYVVERGGDPAAVMDAIDDRLDALRRCLQTTARSFALETVAVGRRSFGPDGTLLSAAVAEVTTMRNYR